MLDRSVTINSNILRITYNPDIKRYKAFNLSNKSDSPIYADTMNELIELINEIYGGINHG